MITVYNDTTGLYGCATGRRLARVVRLRHINHRKAELYQQLTAAGFAQPLLTTVRKSNT